MRRRRRPVRTCPLKARCTNAPQRFVHRHLHDGALQRMQQRATPEAMRLRRSTVEHPFGTLKYRIFGHPRFLLRGLGGAQTEMSLATMAYNLKRMMNVLGGSRLRPRSRAERRRSLTSRPQLNVADKKRCSGYSEHRHSSQKGPRFVTACSSRPFLVSCLPVHLPMANVII